jgi:hypothetical protein
MIPDTKRRPSRKSDSVENNAGTNRRERCVYDGQNLLGSFIQNERSGLNLAWDPRRRFFGRFRSLKEAANAISEVASSAEAWKAATEKALEHLNRSNPEFVSGLPSG